MDFKEWYNNTLADEHTPEKLRAAEHGWNACKQEVLKILKTGELGYNEIFCSDEAIEDIEKL